MALVIYMQYRLDGKHRADHSAGSGDTTAAVQKVQIIHSKPVAQMAAVFGYPVGNLGKRFASLLLLCRVIDKQAFAHAGCAGIYRNDFAVGKLCFQVLHRKGAGVVAARKTGGEYKEKHVFACL